MKKLLYLFILCIISINLFSQHEIEKQLIDSIAEYMEGASTITWVDVADSITTSRIDTIDIILLVSDTAKFNPFPQYLERYMIYDHTVYWIFGKEVITMLFNHALNHIEYLDEEGNKLPNNYIVWDTRHQNY